MQSKARAFLLITALQLCGTVAAHAQARPLPSSAPGAMQPHGILGISEAQLSPGFWVDQLQDADRVVMAPSDIARQNDALLRLDDSVHDLRTLPDTMRRGSIIASIQALSRLPDTPLYDVDGSAVTTDILQSLQASLALDAIPEQTAVRYGLVLKRTALRTFPTDLRVFSAKGETDIDRFQESALFPGTAVAILHESSDGDWLWITSPNYQAWVSKRDIAVGPRAAVLAYAHKTPYRIVTGARVSTVFTREQPALSELQLDMGVRVPLAKVAPDAPVNGQHPYSSWTVELPVRDAAGELAFAPALLQKNQDTSASYLPLTQANLVRQAFKFLGERYGWGHSYNGRDCSGLLSEVYRSMGVALPRNTREQSLSPALKHVTFDDGDSSEARDAAVDALQVGDMIYIPGHAMMMIGRIDGAPYVIHDIHGGSYLDESGTLRAMHLNAVAVTPLLPLHFNQQDSYVDRITSIVRIRP